MAAKNRIQVKPQTQFDIGLGELDIIEEALRYQAQSLSQKTFDEKEQQKALSDDHFKSRMAAIQSVLGKLHNQKVWYVPKESVPLG